MAEGDFKQNKKKSHFWSDYTSSGSQIHYCFFSIFLPYISLKSEPHVQINIPQNQFYIGQVTTTKLIQIKASDRKGTDYKFEVWAVLFNEEQVLWVKFAS